jgi:hypothetical protein
MIHISGALKAVTIITNTWEQSLRFYKDGLGYQLLEISNLSEVQRANFGTNLGKYALLGHKEGSVVRVIETSDKNALPNRLGANPWDCGMAVFEAGTPNIDKAYLKVIRAKFGALATPTEFDCEGPEPLGYVLMKSTAFIGPSGSLLKEQAVDGINVPANCVISIKNRKIQEEFWQKIIGIVPVNDLVLKQPGAAAIMGGPEDMGFDMCLMGYDKTRIGMEQHVYEEQNPDYEFEIIPTDFNKTGLVSAAWTGNDLEILREKLTKNNYPIISNICLPVRGDAEPKGLVFRGPYGEVIELLEGEN